MSEDAESRTERSERRILQAWDEGQIPIGRELIQVGSVGFAVAALVFLGGSIRNAMVRAVTESYGALEQAPFRILPKLLALPALGAAAVCVAAAAGGSIATLVQTRGRIWPERPLPDLTRLWGGGLQVLKIFSRKTLLDLAVAAVKVVALGWAAWSGIHGEFLTLPRWLGSTPVEQLAQAFSILLGVGWRMLLVAGVMAGADVAITHDRFDKKMRVTKPEAKREARQQDGDPTIKGRRRQKHRELARGVARVEVPRADALLVNPTHIAIALRYRRDEGRAPRVIAKGKGALAEFMRDLARENAIPIVQDVPLARLLYRKVRVGREVPASTYKAVAAVLAFVYRVTGRVPGGKATA
jgi:flagellar biosynthesis protein FlhB